MRDGHARFVLLRREQALHIFKGDHRQIEKTLLLQICALHGERSDFIVGVVGHVFVDDLREFAVADDDQLLPGHHTLAPASRIAAMRAPTSRHDMIVAMLTVTSYDSSIAARKSSTTTESHSLARSSVSSVSADVSMPMISASFCLRRGFIMRRAS